MYQIKRRTARVVLVAAAVVGLAAAKPMATMLAELSSFNVSSFAINAGGTTSATATVASVSKVSGVPVISFSSSNTAVATVPSSKIASLSSLTASATVNVTGVAPGCAQIKATYNGVTRSDGIVVHAAPGTTAFGFKVPAQNVPWPGSAEGTLTKTVSLTGGSEPGSGGTLAINRAVWTLTSSNTAVAQVPSSVTQVSSSTTFPIYGKSDGCAIITAKLGTQSLSRTVRVQYIGG